MKILLLGYMASGKSVVGKRLSEKMYLPFIDLDEYIEKQEKLSVSEIFSQKGEIYFRKIEHQYLNELLNNDAKFVLSLGGGTPCYAGNMDAILKADVISFYLQTSVKILAERLIEGKTQRPLVANLSDEKAVEFIAKHVFERRFFYEQAHKTIKTDTKTLKEIVTEIRMLLH